MKSARVNKVLVVNRFAASNTHNVHARVGRAVTLTLPELRIVSRVVGGQGNCGGIGRHAASNILFAGLQRA